MHVMRCSPLLPGPTDILLTETHPITRRCAVLHYAALRCATLRYTALRPTRLPPAVRIRERALLEMTSPARRSNCSVLGLFRPDSPDTSQNHGTRLHRSSSMMAAWQQSSTLYLSM